MKTNKEQIYQLKKKKGYVSVLWNLLFVGAGNIYAGKVGKGFLTMIMSSVIFWISTMFFMIPWIIFYIFVIADGIEDVKKYNELLRLELDT